MTQTNRPLPTAEQVRELLHYDPDTGVFRWRQRRGRVAAGIVAGATNSNGHPQIPVHNRKHFAHRLAWLYVHGEWPAAQIDHINGVRDDNRIVNLREASQAENGRNRRLGSDNTSGAKGVSWYTRCNKWRAQIWLNGKCLCLGLFTNIADAAAAYDRAAIALHGEFARTNASMASEPILSLSNV